MHQLGILIQNVNNETFTFFLIIHYYMSLDPSTYPRFIDRLHTMVLFYVNQSTVIGFVTVCGKLTCSWQIEPVRQRRCKFGAGRRMSRRHRSAGQTCYHWWGRACAGTCKTQPEKKDVLPYWLVAITVRWSKWSLAYLLYYTNHSKSILGYLLLDQ